MGRSLIAFLSDFGSRDPYVAIVHAVIERLSQGRVRVIDISHDLPAYSISAGAYILYTSYRWFPEGTVFLVVVDPGVGTERRAVAAKTKRYWFVGPDNGVLWQSLVDDGIEGVWIIENEELFLKPVSRSFHGRDVFAPAAVHLALGGAPEKLGRSIDFRDLVKLRIVDDECPSGSSFKARIVYIDRFGNVAISLRDKCWDRLCRGRESVRVVSSRGVFRARCLPVFSMAGKGELVLYANSLGFLEFAVNLGNAASLLGVRIGDQVVIYL
ncbi:MAG: SAM-dependent chlorinase/fluorinase [Pyrodictiaceae archaeon]